MMDRFADVISLIYDAGFDEAAFQTLPDRLAGLINGRSCTIQFLEDPSLGLASNYFPSSLWDVYLPHFRDKDIWLASAAVAGVDRFFSFDEQVSYSEFINSEIYNDFYRAAGDDTAHGIGCKIQNGNGMIAIGIHRAKNPGLFNKAEIEPMQTLVPHLKRLHSLRSRLRDARAREDMATEALDRFAYPVMVVAADRRIALSNPAADEVLRREDGLSCRQGKLHAQTVQSDRWLGDALYRAIRAPVTAGSVARIGRAGTQAPHRVLISVMPGRRHALVMLDAPDAAAPIGEQAARLYGLSPSEADLLASLLDGETLEGFAERRGVRITTVRTQLSSLLRKTETARQSQLVAAMAALPRIGPDDA
jgi:DNA-binding CsgD family transcriptional regulator